MGRKASFDAKFGMSVFQNFSTCKSQHHPLALGSFSKGYNTLQTARQNVITRCQTGFAQIGSWMKNGQGKIGGLLYFSIQHL